MSDNAGSLVNGTEHRAGGPQPERYHALGTLTNAEIERIAQRVVELLREDKKRKRRR